MIENSLSDIRKEFLDFFSKSKHNVVQSSPLVPHNDDSLLFTNAGMVLFKNIFTSLSGLLKIIMTVATMISEVKLKIMLKLFFIKTPNIRIVKIDKERKISGNSMFKLLIIINLYLNRFDNYQLGYLQKCQMFPLMA